MTAKTKTKTAKAKPAKPAKAATVYTPASPAHLSRPWAPIDGPSEIAKAEALGLLRPGYVSPASPAYRASEAAYVDCWHSLLSARDAVTLHTMRASIADNNADVAALSEGLGLEVKRVGLGASILQFDALAMARRIEAASARHKNRDKGARGHKGANRNLKYACPICQRSVRSAGSDRIVMCGGTYDRPHDMALCAFDPSSQPAYRQDDAATMAAQAAGDDVVPFVGATPAGVSQSLLQQETAKRRPTTARDIVAHNVALAGDDVVIPF